MNGLNKIDHIQLNIKCTPAMTPTTGIKNLKKSANKVNSSLISSVFVIIPLSKKTEIATLLTISYIKSVANRLYTKIKSYPFERV